jgi:hypothetical protein
MMKRVTGENALDFVGSFPHNGNRDSLLDIETRYRLEGLEFEIRLDTRDLSFFTTFKTDPA